MTGNDHYELIVRRAVDDPDFRERLTENPAVVWAEATGVAVPDDVQLVVLQNTRRTLHVVLPDSRLTLQELDESGGSRGWGLRESFDAMNPDMGFRCSGSFY